jgi:hypothetical protein
MRCTLDRDTAAGAGDLAHRHVLELIAVVRAAKEERATCQLADMQDIPWKEQPLAEDGNEQIGVFARADRAQQNDIGIGA